MYESYNPMDGRAWWATVHGVTNSRTQVSDFTFLSCESYPSYFHSPKDLTDCETNQLWSLWALTLCGSVTAFLQEKKKKRHLIIFIVTFFEMFTEGLNYFSCNFQLTPFALFF